MRLFAMFVFFRVFSEVKNIASLFRDGEIVSADLFRLAIRRLFLLNDSRLHAINHLCVIQDRDRKDGGFSFILSLEDGVKSRFQYKVGARTGGRQVTLIDVKVLFEELIFPDITISLEFLLRL